MFGRDDFIDQLEEASEDMRISNWLYTNRSLCNGLDCSTELFFLMPKSGVGLRSERWMQRCDEMEVVNVSFARSYVSCN